jgi:hypothetical protein
VAGKFGGTAVFGEGEPNETALTATPYPGDPEGNGDDAFVARYNGDGTLAWVEQIACESGEWVHDAETDAAGSTYLLGASPDVAITFDPGGANETTLSPPTDDGLSGVAFLARYGPAGDLFWAVPILHTCFGKFPGGYDRLEISGDGSPLVQCHVDGGMYPDGVLDPGGPNETKVGQGPFIAKYDADGGLQWVRPGVGGYDFAVAADGSYAITGTIAEETTFGAGEPNETVLWPLETGEARSDAFVAAYAPDGQLSWAVRAGGPGYDEEDELGGDQDLGRRVAFLSDGSIAATGDFYGSAVFGPCEPGETTLSALGIYDVFVMRLVP